MAVSAARGEIELDDFIRQFEPFILKTASKSAGKFVAKTDDEWAVSLTAFSEAVSEYSPEKGAFLAFAKLVIKRRCVDYLRVQKRTEPEFPVDPGLFGDGEAEETTANVKSDIAERIASSAGEEQKDLRYEIESVNERFGAYGFSFFDLTDSSPKSYKTKAACAKAVAFILKNPIILEQLKTSKLLPIKIIQNNTNIPRKLLENHRKYIIAAVEILAGDYPYLAEYMRFIREEINK
jgi:RNA polymerase sigma factor